MAAFRHEINRLHLNNYCFLFLERENLTNRHQDLALRFARILLQLDSVPSTGVHTLSTRT